VAIPFATSQYRRNAALSFVLPLAFLAGFAAIQRQSTDFVTKIWKRDTNGRRRLGEKAASRHSGQRICFQAPELARLIHPKIGTAIVPQLQCAMDPKRQFLEHSGLLVR
jgi:hypothetical protein